MTQNERIQRIAQSRGIADPGVAHYHDLSRCTPRCPIRWDLPTGRTIVAGRIAGTYSVQPRHDNYWIECPDLITAIRIGTRGEDRP